MDRENCEGKNGRAPLMMVPMVALFAAVLAIGSCAKHRRHLHQHEGPEGHGGHERHAHPRHHECGCADERHCRRDHGPVKVLIEPLQILEKRFASGEIDEDEFRRRRSVLQENAQ
jgi:hypothetical protein